MNRITTTCLIALTSAASSLVADQLNIVTSFDGAIRESNNSGSFSSQQMLFGRLGTNSDLTGLLDFDLTDPLLTGATINSVTLQLTLNAADGTDSADESSTLNIYEILVPFSTAATWTNRTSSNTWATSSGAQDAGTDRGTDLLASFTGNARSASAGDTLTFTSETDFTTLVANNIGSTISLGAYMDSGSTRALWRVNSNSGLVDLADQPTLIIDYTPVPEPSAYALIAGCLALGSIMVRRRS